MIRQTLWLTFFLESLLLHSQQIGEYKFNHLDSDMGLSNHHINTIVEDDFGFIWIGTLSGLNRFDGYEVTTYYYDSQNPNSPQDNAIILMEKGPNNCLWINTGNGPNLYNTRKESFESASTYLDIMGVVGPAIQGILNDRLGNTWFRVDHLGLIRLKPDQVTMDQITTSSSGLFRISSNQVTHMVNGRDGNIWIIHQNGTIEVIDPAMERIIRKFYIGRYVGNELRIFSFFMDSQNNLWIYSLDSPFGLLKLNTETGKNTLYSEKELVSQVVRGVVERPNGDIWVGVDHGGITIFDKKKGKIGRISNDINDPSSLTSNNINTLYQDSRGIVWVGTTKNGVSYYKERAGNFVSFKVPNSDPAYNDVTSVVESADGNIWLGTDGGGLLRFDRTTKTLEESPVKVPGSTASTSVIVCMLSSSNDDLWIGTYLNGLFKVSKGKPSVFPIKELSGMPVSSVWELFEDSKKNLWIGTLSNGAFQLQPDGGIVRYSQESGLNANYITCTAEDAQGNIWLGCGAGLSVIDPASKSLRNYSTTESGPTISNNSVTSIYRDSEGRMWIGTMDGLNVYDPKSQDFKVYYKKDGMASDIVMAILEDDRGNMWISSNKGITKLEVIRDSVFFKTYDNMDGLQGDIFNEGAALKTRDGMLLFAGQNGFSMFDPDEIEVESDPPSLLFTDFFISNTRIVPGQPYNDREILPLGLNSTREIQLFYDENSFAIGFTAPIYFQPKKTKYQYKLEGFDKGWVNLESETKRVNYTNLDFGSYIFRVRATNNHQDWGENSINLRIKILPPIWQTPAAYFLYMLGLVLLLFLVRKAIIQRERRKSKIKQDQMEEQRLHELDLMKIKFFTNISHEFRTPISLIMTPVERMIEHPETAKPGDFKMMYRNAKRLLNLVNQLLDFRKMEVNQHVLSESSGDLVRFMSDIVDSFMDISRDREIELNFDTELKAYLTRFDKDKMEKIFFNLLSNAFKFTLPGGSIHVSLEYTGKDESGLDWVAIYVSDTGIGISPDKAEAVFNRFFQTEIPSNIINNGSGIGLAITKEFVELHKGTVSVESQENIGSTFMVELPLRDISKDQVRTDEINDFQEDYLEASGADPSKPTVFLVEDNSDFRFYLRDNMKQWYNIHEAADGKEGWKGVLKVIPDIVISDVMMPIMDGLELCRKIKNDPRTSHIPVILLTAQSSDQHRIEGLDSGAIEYISKPFNFEILISNIKSALKFQNRIMESNKKVVVTPSEVSIVSVDEQLIIKATKLVEENISNSEFSVEDLSHELGYSRGHLYQKMLKITGQTPMDFIRNIRMSRAEELLKRSQLNVSEIAYKVGYNNPKLFSRYFKSHFKKYPSELLSEVRNQKNDTPDGG